MRQVRMHECWSCRVKWEKPVALVRGYGNRTGEQAECCPQCGKWEVEILSGQEFYVDSIEVE